GLGSDATAQGTTWQDKAHAAKDRGGRRDYGIRTARRYARCHAAHLAAYPSQVGWEAMDVEWLLIVVAQGVQEGGNRRNYLQWPSRNIRHARGHQWRDRGRDRIGDRARHWTSAINTRPALPPSRPSTGREPHGEARKGNRFFKPAVKPLLSDRAQDSKKNK